MKTNLGIFMLCIVLISCGDSNKTEDSKNNTIEQEAVETTSLKDSLEQRKAAWQAKASSEKIISYQNGIQSIIDNGILDAAVNLGDIVPNFTLTNALGNQINLYDELAKGPVVLMWYRGGWCPYCNITLHYYQNYLPQFEALGAQLIALTPEVPDKSLSTKEKHNLTFHVLSDIGNKVAKDFGVVFKLTPDVAEAYQSNFDLHSYNGDESNELPLAATYVIGKDKVVKYAFLDADYRNRAEPDEFLPVLKSIQ